MTAINPTASTTDHRSRAERYSRSERTGLIGWQRSAWNSVLMAAVTAIACQLVFTVLGFAIGVTATDATAAGAGDAGNLGVAAGVWWLITGTISLLVGGLVLGRMSGIPRSTDLILAALAVWAVTAVFGFFVVWSGLMSAVSSPLAGLSASAIEPSALTSQGGAGSEFAAGSDAFVGTGSRTADQAQGAARTASWWTVIGMLIGAGVTMGGAWMSAPRNSVIAGD